MWLIESGNFYLSCWKWDPTGQLQLLKDSYSCLIQEVEGTNVYFKDEHGGGELVQPLNCTQQGGRLWGSVEFYET